MLRIPGLLPPATAAHWLTMLAARPGGSLKLADAFDLRELLQALTPLRPAIESRLGRQPQLIASQCWVRRARPPHGWHQDGALHHDFVSGPLLVMLTCWIPLVRCGRDAPGLEWVEPTLDTLLKPSELTDDAVQTRFTRFVQPEFAAGEAVLFDGGLLHRTHTTPVMTLPRTSIELRFIAAGPAPPRLAGETLLAFG